MNNRFLLLILILISRLAFGQGPVQKAEQSLQLAAYLDTYYAYFSDSLDRNAFQQATTVAPRSQQFGLNIAQLELNYRASRYRGSLALHYGDIALATWSQEFPVVQEANIGLLIAHNWWLDAGYFRTHIGTESFLPKNNLLSSTAVATYNEPFFQAGARLSFTGIEKLDAQLWVVNGYNYFLDFNTAKSYGLYLAYALSDQLKLSYTSLLGNEAPDTLNRKQYRNYHNLYLHAELKKWQLIAGGDLGLQSNSVRDKPTGLAVMHNALLTVRYQLIPEFSFTARAETFQDPDGFISGLYPTRELRSEGLQLKGITLGTEYKPSENAYLRLETRYLQTKEQLPIFRIEQQPANHRWEVLATMGIVWDKGFTF